MDSVEEVEKDKKKIQDILVDLGLRVNNWDDKKMHILPHEGCGDLINSVILEIIKRGSVNLKYGTIQPQIRIFNLKDKLQRIFSYSKVINGPFPAGAQNVYVIVHGSNVMNLERTQEGFFRFPSFRNINVSKFLTIAQRWIQNMTLVRDINSSNMFAIIRYREKFLNQPLRGLFPDTIFYEKNIMEKYKQIEVSETSGLLENDMTIESTYFFKDLINTILSPNMQPPPNFTPDPSSAAPLALAPPPARSAPPSKIIILVVLGPHPVKKILMEEKREGGTTFYGFPIFKTMNTPEFEQLIVRPNIDVNRIDRIDVGTAMVYICSCRDESQFHNLKTAATNHYVQPLRNNLQEESFSNIYSLAVIYFD
jgi:hypothetical protein